MKKRTLDDAYADLESAYTQWETLYTQGGSDPFWPDGVNLRLVRGHIFYYKKEIDALAPDAPRRADYLRELPPEVEQDYMARPDEIRIRAKAALAAMQADPDYLYLKNKLPRMEPTIAGQLCVGTVVGYVTGLEQAIAEDNLVVMRRQSRVADNSDSFHRTAQKVRELKPPEQEQLCMFYDSSFEEDKPVKNVGWVMQL